MAAAAAELQELFTLFVRHCWQSASCLFFTVTSSVLLWSMCPLCIVYRSADNGLVIMSQLLTGQFLETIHDNLVTPKHTNIFQSIATVISQTVRWFKTHINYNLLTRAAASRQRCWSGIVPLWPHTQSIEMWLIVTDKVWTIAITNLLKQRWYL